VRLGVEGRVPVEFFGRMGGILPAPEEVLDQIQDFEVRIADSKVVSSAFEIDTSPK
jgi:hypothetical protein